MSPALQRNCPVCNTRTEQATLFLAENIDQVKLSPLSFASRKEPERMNHRFMLCAGCDLVYVDTPPGQDALADAYHRADYDSLEEANDAAETYSRIIEPFLDVLTQKHSALEIGTGTGIFLEYLQCAGFTSLTGVEPSTAAIEKASSQARVWIRQGIFKEEDFAPESFDLVCCFMTMEHVMDPGAIARSAYRLLRTGGAFVVVAHDYRSFVNRTLGKRSPIIDIEHMQLFSRKSLRYLLEHTNYEKVTVESFANRYALYYWVKLLPLPAAIKKAIQSVLSLLCLHRVKVAFNLGNMIVGGFKSKTNTND